MVAGGGPLDHLKGSRACGRLLVTHALDATGLRRSSLTPAVLFFWIRLDIFVRWAALGFLGDTVVLLEVDSL